MIRMNGGALWVVQQLLVVLLLIVICSSSIDSVNSAPLILSRKSFPPEFIFGTASASYQYEGAANEGGRGPSIWDFYTHKYPKRIADQSSGDVAVDFYHRYKEDVQIMKNMGLDAFRFSISWSRILPRGSLKGGINKEGIKYYNNLINELLSNGITPFVTIFHWDTPQTLEDEYGGFLSSKIVDDFGDYAELCFKEFGDRVKHWITLNEPYAYAAGGYALGIFAPGRCSPAIGNCTKGNSGTEPYIVGHNLLLSHAKAVKLYRAHYQENQKGMIGVTFVSHWMVPYSQTKANKDAAERALDFMFGWFMEPVSKGEYPKTMKSLVKNRLPEFTEEQSKSLKGSFDFLGLNYYSARYATPLRLMKNAPPSYTTDFLANLTTEKNGVQIGPRAGSDWLYIYPKGIHDLLVYTKKKYGNPVIYITENGVSEVNNASWSLQQALNDTMRVNYYQQHLAYVSQAIKQGVNVKGYFAWSLLDNFEWNVGYTVRFGINYVDYKNGLKRYPKLSVSWFKKLLKRETP